MLIQPAEAWKSIRRLTNPRKVRQGLEFYEILAQHVDQGPPTNGHCPRQKYLCGASKQPPPQGSWKPGIHKIAKHPEKEVVWNSRDTSQTFAWVLPMLPKKMSFSKKLGSQQQKRAVVNFNEPPGGFKRRIRPVIGDWAQVLPRRKQLPCRGKHSSHFPKVQARTLRQARNTENSPNDAATRGRFWPVKGNHGETEGTRGKHRETNGNQATLGVKLFIVPVLVSWQVHEIYMCGLWHQLISSPGVRPYLRPKQQPILQSPARLSSALARRRDLARPESPSPS